MKQYVITLTIGSYPLSRACDTIAEAYDCMVSLTRWVPRICFDADELMATLVRMKDGDRLSSESYGYRIEVKRGCLTG